MGRAVGPLHAAVLLQQEPLERRRAGGPRSQDLGLQKTTAGKFDLGVGFLPGGPEETSPVCPTGGAGVGIPKKIAKENQLAAAKFIGFLTNPENTVKFSAATGYMPVRTSADTSSLLAANPLAGEAIKQLDVTRPQDYARAFLPAPTRRSPRRSPRSSPRRPTSRPHNHAQGCPGRHLHQRGQGQDLGRGHPPQACGPAASSPGCCGPTFISGCARP
ncbi:hypothetical protein brsh051_24790 [Brooklawnia propionicigenes]|uniref:Extracellular solute-binding protein n=1 Tax=Brooklawnia propionicigenes TaxID=3041175 RepID=A0AAN0K7N9_9ACTN|nr:hypothetical protein brsh051_24790 [Brooklawnia sp. SH051]